MANVSFVPASYIFLRGQGVKITSIVTKECSNRNTRIPELIKIPNLNEYVKMAKNNFSEEEIQRLQITAACKDAYTYSKELYGWKGNYEKNHVAYHTERTTLLSTEVSALAAKMRSDESPRPLSVGTDCSGMEAPIQALINQGIN